MNERRDNAGAFAPAFKIKTQLRTIESHRLTQMRKIELANAAQDLAGLVGRAVRLARDGEKWRGLCPFHGDQRVSTFVVDPKTNHFSCSVCGAEGDALSWIMQSQGLCFHQTVALALKQPIQSSTKQKEALRSLISYASEPPSDEAARRHKREMALKTWQESRPAARSLVERYLYTRGIVFDGDLPESLRFHPNLYHEPSRQYFPAMIAAARQWDGSFTGVHRTYLSPDGLDTAHAEKGGIRRMLSDCFGAHVHIQSGSSKKIVIVEDIEGALSIAQACPELTVWAAMALNNLKAPVPPDTPEIILCVNANNPDPHMAERIFLEAARTHAERGHKVLATRAPRGADFNDVLLSD